MKPPSQGGRGCRVKLAMLVLIGLFTIAQGVLPGQTEDIDRHQDRHPLCYPPCQAGALRRGSKPVSRSVPVPGTSLLSGSTGTTSPPPRITMNHHGHFGSSLELDPGSTQQLAVSDTRRGGPPVSDTRSEQRSAAADTERVKRPVSDTSLLDQGASVSDTRTMATASDDDITIYIASAGVQNAEQAAGMPEPWTLPGSNNSRYYDEPQYTASVVRQCAPSPRATAPSWSTAEVSETRMSTTPSIATSARTT